VAEMLGFRMHAAALMNEVQKVAVDESGVALVHLMISMYDLQQSSMYSCS